MTGKGSGGPLPPWAAPYFADFRRIERAITLASGFALLPIELPGEDVARALAAWLEQCGHGVRSIDPGHDDEVWRHLVASLDDMHPGPRDVVQVIGPRVDSPGLRAGLRLLNQRRDSVGRALGRPLLWCGPREFLDMTWAQAPDFWSIGDVPRRIASAPAVGDAATRAPRVLRLFLEERSPDELSSLYASAREQGDMRSAAQIGIRLALALFDRDEHARSKAVVTEVLALPGAESDPSIAGAAHSTLGYLALEEGDTDRAESEVKTAVAKHREAHDRTAEAHALTQLADVYVRKKDFAAADVLLKQALPMFSDDLQGEAAAQLVVGELRGAEGRAAESDDAFARTGALLGKAGGSPLSKARVLNARGLSLLQSGRWTEAEPLFREALRLQEKGSDTATNRGATLHNLASGLHINGRWADAEPLYRAALRLAEGGGDSETSRADTIAQLARGLLDNGRRSEAEPLFRRALTLYGKYGSAESRAVTTSELARGLRDEGRWPEAAPLFREALELFGSGAHSVTNRGRTLHDLAVGVRDNGKWEEAEPLFREALRLKKEGGAGPAEIAQTQAALDEGLRANQSEREASPDS